MDSDNNTSSEGTDNGDGFRTIHEPTSLRLLLETNSEPIAVRVVSAEHLPEFGNVSRYDHWVFLCETDKKYYHGVVILKDNDGEKVAKDAIFDLFLSKEDDDANPYNVRPIEARPRA